MKHAIVVLILGISFVTIGFAQEVTSEYEVKWSEELEGTKTTKLEQIIGTDGDHHYMLMRDELEYELLKFSDDLRLVAREPLDLKYNDSRHNFQFVVMHNGELFFFTSRQVPGVKRIYLYAEKIDKKTLRGNGALIEVAVVENAKYTNSVDFGYDFSEDDHTLAVYHSMPGKVEEAQEVAVIVFTEQLKEMWRDNIRFPFSREYFNIARLTVDDRGGIVLLGQKMKEVKLGPDAVEAGRSNYHWELVVIQDKGKKRFEFSLESDKHFITDICGIVDHENKLHCVGFYSTSKTKGIRGAMYLKIDCNTGAVMKSSMSEFDTDFLYSELNPYQRDKAERKGKEVELQMFNLKNIVLYEGGGCILLAEQFEASTATSRFVTPYVTFTSVSQNYKCLNIIAVRVDKTGDIEWEKKIRKRQYTINDEGLYSSFGVQVIRDKIYIIFNDHVNNLNREEGRPIAVTDFGPAGIVSIVDLETNGEFTRELLYTNKEVNCFTAPMFSEQVSENELIIFARYRDRFRFACATFE
jgi:hypothetical protein